MLVSLRFAPTTPVARDDAFALLLDCHQRIRNFLGMGLRLLEATGAPERDVAEVAGRLVRYFTQALPKHVEDEDASLMPRLRACELPPGVSRALEEMGAQHREQETLLAVLVPQWQRLLEQPAQWAALVPTLRGPTERLAEQMEAHLLLEERVLFPTAGALLPPEALAALAGEMRARRQPMAPPRE